jgi:hypothetical protein
MSRLCITVFGKFDVRCDDEALEGLDTRKVQELFCYLLLNRDQPHSREALASLLWDEDHTDQPQPADRAAAIGGSLQTGSDSLERHQTQADLDGFVHPLHRLRGQMPPISSHPPLVYRADLV